MAAVGPIGDARDMAKSPRDQFIAEVERIETTENTDVREALLGFAEAVDPERSRPTVPKPRPDGTVDHTDQLGNSTAAGYLRRLRLAHQRGLDLLGTDTEGVNSFMDDLTTEPERRHYDVVEYNGSITKPSARQYQAAARAFYRFCAEPGAADDRPTVAVEWPADDVILFTDSSDPKFGPDDMLTDAELDALREACLKGRNPRRDRAFIELLAGTGQRIYALVTLRVGDVYLDGTDESSFPHVLLNPEIKGDGDKDAIEHAGRLRPIVSDVGPVREWVHNHPLRDADVRAGHGAPDAFDDCFLFVGDIAHWHTDASEHWDTNGARELLGRLKERTASMPSIETVTHSVAPHNFRHWTYTKSEGLPIDASDRRKMFGWAPGSDTGETVYGHTKTAESAERFAEAWANAFGDGEGVEGVAEQVVGAAAAGDLAPEARKAIVSEILADDELKSELAGEIADVLAAAD